MGKRTKVIVMILLPIILTIVGAKDFSRMESSENREF
jgi:hypothetical protein